MAVSFSGFSEYDRRWRQERSGFYVVTDFQGNPIWTKAHISVVQKNIAIGHIATLLEPGRLWAWGKTKEEAFDSIYRQVERIRGTRALPIAEVKDEETGPNL